MKLICPNCGFEGANEKTECAKCGIIFSKYKKSSDVSVEKIVPKEEEPVKPSSVAIIKEVLFSIATDSNKFYFAGRVFLFIFVFIWGSIMILSPLGAGYASNSFMHFVNLPFHEAGHIFFRPFGQWMTSLGGTLGQLMMPLVCLGVILLKARNPFGASICTWWFGENFMDITPYINDARSLSLPLLGGNTGANSPYGFHDWEYILKEIGMIQYDHVIAKVAFTLGTIFMIVSFIWGGYLLFKEYEDL